MSRFKHVEMSEDSKKHSDLLRDKTADLADYINVYCIDSREKSIALTKLEECMFWVNACLSRNG